MQQVQKNAVCSKMSTEPRGQRVQASSVTAAGGLHCFHFYYTAVASLMKPKGLNYSVNIIIIYQTVR